MFDCPSLPTRATLITEVVLSTPPRLSLAAIALSAVITDRNRATVIRKLRSASEPTGNLALLADVIHSASTDPPPRFVESGQLLAISGTEANTFRSTVQAATRPEPEFATILVRVYRIASGVNVVTAWFCLRAAVEATIEPAAGAVPWRLGDAASAAANESRTKCERWMGSHFPRSDHESVAGTETELRHASLLLCTVNTEEHLHLALVSHPHSAAQLLGGDNAGDLWDIVSSPPPPHAQAGLGAVMMASSQDPEHPMLFLGGTGDIRRKTEEHASVLGQGVAVFDPSRSLTGESSINMKLAHAYFAGIDQILAVRAYAAEIARADFELSRASATVAEVARGWAGASVSHAPALLTQYFSLLGNVDELLLELAELPDPYTGTLGKLRAVRLRTDETWGSASADLYTHAREQTKRLATRVRARHPVVSENVKTMVDALYAHDSNIATARSIKIASLAFVASILIPFLIFGLESCGDSMPSGSNQGGHNESLQTTVSDPSDSVPPTVPGHPAVLDSASSSPPAAAAPPSTPPKESTQPSESRRDTSNADVSARAGDDSVRAKTKGPGRTPR
jgi:hypothetical protein